MNNLVKNKVFHHSVTWSPQFATSLGNQRQAIWRSKVSVPVRRSMLTSTRASTPRTLSLVRASRLSKRDVEDALQKYARQNGSKLKTPELPFDLQLLLNHEFFSELHMFQHNVPCHRTISGSQRFQNTKLVLSSL